MSSESNCSTRSINNITLLSRSTTRECLGRAVIAQAAEINNVNVQQSKSLIWGSINAFVVSLIFIDIFNRCPAPWTFWQNVECTFAVVLFLNTVYHTCCYIYYFKVRRPVEATRSQQLLVGCRNSVLGNHKFCTLSKNHISAIYKSKARKPLTKNTAQNYHDTSLVVPSPKVDRSSLGNSSLNLTAFSFDRSRRDSLNNSDNGNLSSSQKGSPNNATISPTSGNAPKSLTPTSPGFGVKLNKTADFIKDVHSLDQYLKEFTDIDKFGEMQRTYDEPSGIKIWSHPSSSEPRSSNLVHNQYQLAYTVTDDTSGASAKDKSSPSMKFGYIDFWKKRGINPNHVSLMCDDLRVWISSTILIRVADEINVANEHFMKHGHSELRIGHTCIERLRKSSTLHNGPRSLSTLVPFLDFSNNQEYLVHRIKELAKSRCMSDFRWNSGSLLFHGKAWDTHLPTDSALVMHLLATYLDGQLVPLPQQPDGKPFTSEYLCTNVLEKPVSTPGKFKIHQTEINPPHYVLVTENAIHEAPKGRNNLFHTILLFLQYIKKTHHGMLGRVSLGPAGVNLLWVVDRKA